VLRARNQWRQLIVAGLLILMCGSGVPAAAQTGELVCETAGKVAERELDLPPGLLLAIGRVESGRRSPVSGRVAAWPWTINANGAGQLFGTPDEALMQVRSLQRSGVTSIDVGCFQINLFHHPTAFATLEKAFDPQANATYAAQFLTSLRARTGSWDRAVAAYHSSTLERGNAYRARVFAGLDSASLAAAAPVPRADRVLVWSQTASAGGVRIWTPSAPGYAPTVITLPRRAH
jgi:hypothetical protein